MKINSFLTNILLCQYVSMVADGHAIHIFLTLIGSLAQHVCCPYYIIICFIFIFITECKCQILVILTLLIYAISLFIVSEHFNHPSFFYSIQDYDLVNFHFHCFCLRQFTHCFSQAIITSMARIPSPKSSHFLLVLTLYHLDKFHLIFKISSSLAYLPNSISKKLLIVQLACI